MGETSYASRQNTFGLPFWENGLPRLSDLDIELTERCNNTCIHCYINIPKSTARWQQELSTAVWKTILSQAASLGALSIRMTGGEPLLREDFADLYLHARRLGMKVQLFTNACCITPKLADLFARIPPLEKIEITVYGMTKETYEAVSCAPGSFEEFQRGINLLLERRVPFIVKSVILPQNRSDQQAFEAWAATLPWMEKSPSYSLLLDLRGRRDSAARNRQIAKMRLSPQEYLAQVTRQPGYREEMTQFCQRCMGASGAKLFTCGAGKQGSIDAYGRYQPCMLLRDPNLSYDLRQGTLKDALENFFPKIRQMEATNPAYLERCARCFLHGLCEQCPAKSWEEHGTLDTPVEYYCQVAHAQAHDLGLLSEGEKAWEVTDGPERVKRMTAEEQ